MAAAMPAIPPPTMTIRNGVEDDITRDAGFGDDHEGDRSCQSGFEDDRRQHLSRCNTIPF
jgi:hypothetical protein